MGADQSIIVDIDRRGLARITLNRGKTHNAFDADLIGQFSEALHRIKTDSSIRVLVLGGAGASFCAGADLRWMQQMATFDHARNLEDARRLAALMAALKSLPIPSIARVHGDAFGGGVGLVACCDMAIAAQNATFCLSEVRLGLIPAVISPYLIAAMGARAARRHILTAERFDAKEALTIGLVDEVCASDRLDERVERRVEALLKGGPKALIAAKKLIDALDHQDPVIDTAEQIALLRASDEGREGIAAFLEKRRPAWRGDPDV